MTELQWILLGVGLIVISIPFSEVFRKAGKKAKRVGWEIAFHLISIIGSLTFWFGLLVIGIALLTLAFK